MGCGAKWTVTEQKFFKYQNKDVRLAARLQMAEESHQVVDTKKGTDLETRLYTDDYVTKVYQTTERVGVDLEEADTTSLSTILTVPITEIRLGGTDNSYPRLCLEMRLGDSNVSEWTKVGCVNRDDTPSESPTGGIGRGPVPPPSPQD